MKTSELRDGFNERVRRAEAHIASMPEWKQRLIGKAKGDTKIDFHLCESCQSQLAQGEGASCEKCLRFCGMCCLDELVTDRHICFQCAEESNEND